MFRRTSLALLVLALIAASSLAQKTLKVPSQHKTIQAAIDAAKAADTVLVAPGIYKENIDFKGKAIHVRSSHGPEVTTVHGGGKAVVTFQSSETLSSILEGFTITGGGRGVEAHNAGPLITGNIICGNLAYHWSRGTGVGVSCQSTPANPGAIIGNTIEFNAIYGWAKPLSTIVSIGGGGLDCTHAVIMGNVIRSNRVEIPKLGDGYRSSAIGGGLIARSCLVSNNLFHGNAAIDNHFGPINLPAPKGGGIYAGDSKIVGNTIVGNRVDSSAIIHWAQGGGVYAFGNSDLINNIIRGNKGGQVDYPTQKTVIQTCNIEGGPSGNGNIDVDPGFIGDGSYHLRHDSKCRNAGTRLLSLSASDFDWNDRGFGGGVDIGADEFAPHFYHVGASRPGRTITLTAVGPPGRIVTLGWSARTLAKPLNLPGVGQLWLDPKEMRIWVVGALSSAGVIQLPLSIPQNAPVGSIAFQALVGQTLTQPDVIQVTP